MNTHTFDIISSLLSLIKSEDFESDITALSSSCEIPLGFTRKFILQLMNNTILSSCLDGTDPDNPDPESSVMELFSDEKERFSAELLAGKYDDVIWSLDLRILNHDDDQLLGLSALEYGALQNLSGTELPLKHSSVFEQKDNITKISKSARKNQEIIQNAITGRHAISFLYRDVEGNLESHQGFPINIFTNVSDNWVYFELANDYTFRLDRITSAVKELKNYGPFPVITDDPKKKYMWGSYYDARIEPEHVKIVVTDVNPNLIQKIRNDIRHREGLCKFYQEGDFYYYEDDIIGMKEFKRWLRGYGSSIQVIEPAYVREEIIASANKALLYYAMSDSWNNL